MENIELQYSNNGFLMQGIHNGQYLDKNEISKVIFNALEGENLPPEASSPELLGGILRNFSEGWLKPIQSVLGRKGINFTVKGDSPQYNLRENTQMTNEQLRMQMLAGVITESEYKAKLQENQAKETSDEKIERYEKYTYTLNGKKVEPEIAFYNNILKAELDGEIYRISEPINGKIELNPIKGKTGIYTESNDKVKKSLKENFIGMGAINNPFASRKKESYEDAFEHFLSERYETKFENREQDLKEGEGKEELVNKIKNLGDFGLTGDEIEFNGLLITSSTQEDEGGPYYFVYGEDDDSEDGIFQSTDPNKIAEFVLNY
jgi:hypothetical protein